MMINGKITETMLAVTNTGLTMQLAIGFKENKEIKNIITAPISIRNLSEIISILRVIGVSNYEAIKNCAIQFEITEGNVSKIANFCDSELEIKFAQDEGTIVDLNKGEGTTND